MYKGEGFHRKLSKSKVSGDILVTETHISMEQENVKIELPIEDLVITKGGNNHKTIILENPSVKDQALFTTDFKILNNNHLKSNTDCKKQITKLKATSGLKVALTLLILAIISVYGFQTIDTLETRSKLLSKLSPKTKTQIGQYYLSEVNQTAILKPIRVDALSKITTSLNDTQSGIDYTYTMIENTKPTALGLPGGHIIIFSGLIDKTEKPEELLGIIAQKMGHIHHQYRINELAKHLTLTEVIALYLGSTTAIKNLLSTSPELATNDTFSEQKELKADEYAWNLLLINNISPLSMIQVMERIHTEQEKSLHEINETPVDQKIKHISSNPTTIKRIDIMKTNYQTLDEEKEYQTIDENLNDLKGIENTDNENKEPLKETPKKTS